MVPVLVSGSGIAGMPLSIESTQVYGPEETKVEPIVAGYIPRNGREKGKGS
jgi:hypothetical protein